MFNINLKQAREDKGLTQEELAKRVNVVRQTISKWERGLSMPEADLLMQLATELDTSIEKLLGCEGTTDLSQMAVQLALINQQMTIRNNREDKIWSTLHLIIKIAIGIFIASIIIPLIMLILGFLLFSTGGSTSTGGNTYSVSESIEIYQEEIYQENE